MSEVYSENERLVIILPHKASIQIERLHKELLAKADKSNLSSNAVRCRPGRVSGNGWKRPVELVNPRDASDLYRTINRQRTAVVSFTAAYVRRDPSTAPPVGRRLTKLETFVRHKAHFALIRSSKDITMCLADLRSWPHTPCLSEDDPRVLPLQTFESKPDWPDLDTESGAAAFKHMHGGPAIRRDREAKVWMRARRSEYHGRESLVVGGFALDAGMHWDVSAEGRTARLLTANEVWKIDGRNAYLNVYPDGYVRPRSSSRGARIVWPQR